MKKMNEPFLTVNMHCHSSFSDGILPVDELVDFLSKNSVQFASLTDHDTVKGQELFHDLCVKRGIGFVSGIEITASSEWGELHLLGYGFNYKSEAVKAFFPDDLPSRTAADYRSAIDLVHSEGGKIFLAHPFTVSKDISVLTSIISRLKEAGLDGIEALYGMYDDTEQKKLLSIAEELNLLVSAGTDYHGFTVPSGAGGDPVLRKAGFFSKPGESISYNNWKKFRSAVISNSAVKTSVTAGNTGTADSRDPSINNKKEISRISYLKIIFPAFLTVLLFTVTIFNILIPKIEDVLLARKKEMIKELTNSAVSILEEFNLDVENKLITEDDAKQKAAKIIEYIRYGGEHKDYFWITDMKPVMIVHPYKKELEGKYVGDYKDNAGTAVFMKFVEAVRKNREGYVEYQWQWKDEESRIMSKLSYVKLYEPWGWIIGTGIYIDDLQIEIKKIESFIIGFSVVIIVTVSILLFFLVTQSIKSEKVKQKKEKALAESNEKYRTLVSATGEGTLIIQNGKCTYSNPKIQNILGYTEDELLLLAIQDIIVPESVDSHGRFYIESLMHNEILPSVCETGMRKKDGKFIDVILETDRIKFSGGDGFIINVRETEKSGRLSYIRDRKKNKIIGELQTAILFLSEPVVNIAEEAVICPMKTRIREAASVMTEKKVSSIFISSADGEVIGIVTDHDIRMRAVSEQINTQESLYKIMSSPVISVSGSSLIYEAISVMRRGSISHLAVRDEGGNPYAVVRAKELLAFHKYPAAVLTSEINSAGSFTELRRSFSKMPVMMKTLVDTGVKPRNITRMISSFSDSLTARIIELAESELGPPPVSYAFISPGSHGRGEPTLVSDQDNAIIYIDMADNEKEKSAVEYFLKLGELVCAELAKSGFELCKGKIMASNPAWVCSLSGWKKYFTAWITEPKAEELLKFNMFFDFRVIYGDSVPAKELRSHIKRLLAVNPPFFAHLAQNTLLYKTPLGFMGNIIFNTDDSSNQIFDIKEALLPIVSFARIYALKHNIENTNTWERLLQLNEKGIILESSYNEIKHVYDFLMQMRLNTQSAAMDNNLEPGNSVSRSSLTNIETALLKNSLNQISDIQKKIIYDFMGGVNPS